MRKVFYTTLLLALCVNLLAQKSVTKIDSLLFNGESYLAIKEAKLVLKKEPNNYVVKMKLAQSYRLNSQYREALAALNSMSRKSCGSVFYCEKGQNHYHLRNADSAVVAFSKAQQLNPASYQIAGYLAKIYFARDKYNEALKQYQIMDSLQNESNSSTKTMVGRCLISLKRNKEAISCFKKAIAVDSLIMSNYDYLASLYDAYNKRDSAQYVLMSAIKAAPNNAYAYKNMADFYANVNHFYRSIPLYESFLDLDIEGLYTRIVLIELGKEYINIKNLDKAKSYLLDVYSTDDKDYVPCLHLAKIYNLQENLDSALYFATRADKFFGFDKKDQEDILVELATAYEKNRDWEKVVKVYIKLALESRKYLTGYYYMKAGVILYDNLKRPQEALIYLNTAIDEYNKSKLKLSDWHDFTNQKINQIKAELFFKS